MWRENIIKPIFKGGDMNDPSCYRGIALSSCLSKLFTRILYNRLDNFLENNDIICNEQKGFRKDMRTSDHIFTLKSLIDKYFKKNKYIFASFIDLKTAFDTVNRNALLYKLYQLNTRGKFFNILENMYKEVSFCVSLNDGLTDNFQTNIGVKQGCILSPTLFSLYMNDLIGHFSSDCEPLTLDGKNISCLLYADDIVLLSESSNGLQNCLNNLKLYCDKWNLEVNIDKSKIIIFNKSGKVLKGYSFFYNNQSLGLVNQYKYLGIILKPSGSFVEAINHLSKKASKAMFCISKALYSEKRNVSLHIKLFDTCVKPILLYCSEIWALPQILKGKHVNEFEYNYDKFIPTKIQLKFSKFILGVHKSASNLAVLGELGFYPLAINALKSSVEYWFHLLKAKNSDLIARAYHENSSLGDSLYNKFKTFLELIGFEHIWDNQGTFSKRNTLNAIFNKLKDRFHSYWSKMLFNDEKNVGGNKLRTYRKFKNDFKMEQFLHTDIDKFALSNFIRIRISNCNLNIEKGRHFNIPVEQRICELCHDGIEDEFHFLMQCKELQSQRVELIKNIVDIVPSFSDLSREEQFLFMLTSNDLDICKVLITGINNMYNVNQMLKKNI